MIRSFIISNEAIHKFAATLLLSRYEAECILKQGKFAYRVKGGIDGHLYYRKGKTNEWVLIANWCFYGLYIVVRYRKAVWLRQMYQSLFTKMNFVSVLFDEYAIEIVGTDGQILRSRRFRLTPPRVLDKVMSEKFGFSGEKIRIIRQDLGIE